MCLEHHTHGLATYNAELYMKYIRDCYKANRNIIIWSNISENIAIFSRYLHAAGDVSSLLQS